MAKETPKGETPEEARERIAPSQAFFDIHVQGTGPVSDAEPIRKAFRKLVLLLREAGVTVGGALTGKIEARILADDTRVDQVVLHDVANDVVDED
jgi:hypothetical protein